MMVRKLVWIKYVTFMLVGFMMNATTFGDDYFTLIRTIAVDDVGIYGQIDGNEFSKDNQYITASDNHAKVKIYDRATGAFIGLSRHFILNNTSFNDAGKMNAVGFNYAGTLFMSGLNDVGLKIWDFTTFIPNPPDDNNWPQAYHFVPGTEVDGADFSHNDNWLATASDNDIKVFDMTTAGFPEVDSFNIPQGAVNHLDFSFDDSLLAVCGNSGGVVIKNVPAWTVHSINKIYVTGNSGSAPSVKRIYFSPDATMYAIAARNQICRVFRTSDGALLKDLKHKGNLTSIVCVPQCDDPDNNPAIETLHWGQNGEYLLTGGVIDGIVRCWRVDDWSLVATVRGQSTNRQIESLYVSSIVAPGVNQVHEMITGGDEGVLYHFDFHPPALKQRYEQPAGGGTFCLDVLDNDASVPLGPDGAAHEWTVEADAQAVGGQCLRALPDNGTTKDSNYATYDPLLDTPKLDYRMTINTTGNYYVWMRSKGNSSNNAIHVGIDGVANASSDKMDLISTSDFGWTKATKDGADARLNITSTGDHTLNVWMCEDGTRLDRILLTLDGGYDPSTVNGGDGPAASIRPGTVAPDPAANPSPTDGATDVSTSVNLGWSAGAGAASHTVHFGTSATPPVVSTPQPGTTYDPAPLLLGKTYYWQVDETNVIGTTPGTVWSFSTSAPGPGDFDGDGDVDDGDLNEWKANYGVPVGTPLYDGFDFLTWQRNYTGPPIPVPDVVDFNKVVAENTITTAGLSVGTTTTAYHPTIILDNVISSNPAAGEELLSGEPVSLLVSLGPSPFTAIYINFQIDTAPYPVVGFPAYLEDTGLIYGARGNGQTYGWVGSANGDTRLRGIDADQRYDTLNHMSKNGDTTWEIELPNGDYTFTVLMGDPGFIDSVNDVMIEGTVQSDPDGQDNFDLYTDLVRTVSDGKLTFTTVGGVGTNAKICYLAITAFVSSGGATIPVGNYLSQTETTANGNIASDGLTVGTPVYVNDAAAADTVIGQSPSSGTQVAPGSQVILTVSSGPAPPATYTITTSGSAPTTNVEDSVALSGTDSTTLRYSSNSASDNIDRGQTFTPSTSYSLDKITIHAQSVSSGAPGADVSVEIWGNSGSWSLLQTSTGAAMPGGLSAGNFVTFDIDNIALSSGTQYGFVLLFDDVANNREMDITRLDPGPYGAGDVLKRNFTGSRGGATFPGLDAPRDLVFYIESVPPPLAASSAAAPSAAGAELPPAMLSSSSVEQTTNDTLAVPTLAGTDSTTSSSSPLGAAGSVASKSARHSIVVAARGGDLSLLILKSRLRQASKDVRQGKTHRAERRLQELLSELTDMLSDTADTGSQRKRIEQLIASVKTQLARISGG